MRSWAVWGAVLAGCLALIFAGCSPETLQNLPEKIPGVGDSSLHVHAVESIKTVRVHRVAVMPLIDYPDVTERNSIQEGAAQSMTAQLYSQMQLAGGWEVVPEDEVIAALDKMTPTTRANLDQHALAMARQVSADAVIYGTVHKYQDRIGSGYAASRPASVAFTLFFASRNAGGQIIWRARFAKTQQSLSQNAFNILNWLHNQGRWVRAVDIATTGVQDAVNNLHSKLNLMPGVKFFPVPNELSPGPH